MGPITLSCIFIFIIILNALRCPYVSLRTTYYVRMSVTLGVASSVANDIIMRTTAVGVSRAGSPASVWNDVIMRMTSQ